MLVEIKTQGWGVVTDRYGQPRANLTAVLTRASDAGAATVYDEPGGDVVSSVVTNDDGEIPGFIEEGPYALSVGGETFRVEAVSGAPLGWLNVRLFGAKGDGSTDDTAAIQAAIDAAEDAGGGTVFIPIGDYVVNGGLVIPPSVPIRLLGGNFAANSGVNTGGAVLRRSSGTATVIRAAGTAFAVRAWLAIEHLRIHGGNTAGRGIDLERCQHVHLHRVRVSDCLHNGIRCRQVFNSSGEDIYVHACGDGTTHPAWLFDAVDDDPQGACDTCLFANVQFEGNTGTDLRLAGSVAQTSPANVIQFANVKMEGGAGAFPFIDLAYAQSCSFSNLNLNAGARTTTPIQENRPFSGTRSNKFSNVAIDLALNTPYAAQLSQGSWNWSNVTVNGAGGHSAVFRVEAAVAHGSFRVAWESLLTNFARSALISDARLPITPELASAATLTLPAGELAVRISGTTNITSITPGRPREIVVLRFLDALTVTDGGNLFLAGNFNATADDTLTLVGNGTNWYEIARSVN